MNGAGNFRMIADNFTESKAEDCELLLRTGEGYFSFAIVDNTQNAVKVVGFESGDFAKSLRDEHLFQEDFSSVKIAFDTFDFTFIPQELFNPNDLASYAKFIKSPSTKIIHVSPIEAAGIINVWGREKSLSETLFPQLASAKFFNQANSLIQASFPPFPNPEPTLVLNFNSTTFEALVLQDSALNFYNIFNIESPDEFNYFLLLLLQQQAINPQELMCVLAGEIEIGDEYYNRLNKYFTSVEFAETRGLTFDFSDNYSAHRFFSLLGLNSCE